MSLRKVLTPNCPPTGTGQDSSLEAVEREVVPISAQLPPRDQAQIDSAFSEVMKMNSVSIDDWNDKMNDVHFGSALQYITRVAFFQRPFARHTNDIQYRVWSNIMGDNFNFQPLIHDGYTRISFKITVADPSILNYCAILDKWHVSRQFWLVKAEDGGAVYLNLQPIITPNTVESASAHIEPFVCGSGVPLATEINRLGWLSHEPSERHHVVIVTYVYQRVQKGPNFKTWRRVCFTVVKPPKDPLVLG